MERNENGKWQCPVLCKPFSDNIKIAAICQAPENVANVYSFEAVQELNFKRKCYEDLISGKKFHRTRDVIIISDKNDPARNINNFKHMTTLREEKQASLLASKGNENESHIRHSVTAARIMKKIKHKREEEEIEKSKKMKLGQVDSTMDGCSVDKGVKIFTDDITGVRMTSGKTSGSFTSTAMSVSNDNETREATKDEILESQFNAMKKLKKKGLVRFTTNMGMIEFELHCDIAPRACTNFIGLVEQGKYNESTFHRSIRNFMIQGGKPLTKGEIEKSLWGEPFSDEYDDRLCHDRPGILSMANAGPGTNKQQFFITYKSAPHLNRMHSVFGQVVSGIDVLNKMEAIPTNKKDHPKKEIKIVEAIVLVNPVKEAEKKESLRIKKIQAEKRRGNIGQSASSLEIASLGAINVLSKTIEHSKTVGKYILPKDTIEMIGSKSLINNEGSIDQIKRVSNRLPPPPKKIEYSDFSGW